MLDQHPGIDFAAHVANMEARYAVSWERRDVYAGVIETMPFITKLAEVANDRVIRVVYLHFNIDGLNCDRVEIPVEDEYTAEQWCALNDASHRVTYWVNTMSGEKTYADPYPHVG